MNTGAEKDPDNLTTGQESMTGAQTSCLRTLSEEAGEKFDARPSEAGASPRIDALQQKAGRGRDHRPEGAGCCASQSKTSCALRSGGNTG